MQTKESILAQRDALLEATRRHVDRHYAEKYVGLVSTTLTETQMHELLGYQLRLHDIEKHPDFPSVTLPAPPSFCPDALVIHAEG